MKPAMYIFINKGLGMSPGKIAAQASHAACLSLFSELECFSERTSGERLRFEQWWDTGHYTKYIMEAPDTDRLNAIKRYLEDRGFKTFLVIDEGHTEGTYFQPTALGVELVDKSDDRTKSIFESFKTYKDRL